MHDFDNVNAILRLGRGWGLNVWPTIYQGDNGHLHIAGLTLAVATDTMWIRALVKDKL
jgi:hypothetical protein